MQVSFSATKLKNTGKKGIIVPDSDGAYTIILGALNSFNSSGQYYDAPARARELFSKSSTFMRRISNGALKAELGHPEFSPGMTEKDFIRRLYKIEDKNVSAAIIDVWLDFDFGKKNPKYGNQDLIAIMGRVVPSGPYGEALKRSLDNPNENVSFSIRAFTDDKMIRGVMHRTLVEVITFDQVNEGGISIANKYDSPSLETMVDRSVSLETIKELIDEPSGIALESVNMIRNFYNRYTAKVSTLPSIPMPSFSNW